MIGKFRHLEEGKDEDEKESSERSIVEPCYQDEALLSEEIRSEEIVEEKDNGGISVAQRLYPGEPLFGDIDWFFYYCISSERNAIGPTPPRVEFHASNPHQAYCADAACCCLSLFMPMTTLSFGVMPLLSYLSATLSAPGFTASIVGALFTYAVCCLPSFHNLACIPIHLLEGRHPEGLRLPFPFLLCCRFSIIDASSRPDGEESRGLFELNRSPTVIVTQPMDEGLLIPDSEEGPVVVASVPVLSELYRHITSCFIRPTTAQVAIVDRGNVIRR